MLVTPAFQRWITHCLSPGTTSVPLRVRRTARKASLQPSKASLK
ncbi:hypothetical protein THTE_1487 [Thermogutta terrifontis]|uniref:Uncharacterized protein n=1 Tax=Thermogutta terrifontis TaxID=1331910 RepID=A0A286RDQ0_9BACT|nr:hypothetical protein THTE_1487 [Thermogutta terrifontis]